MPGRGIRTGGGSTPLAAGLPRPPHSGVGLGWLLLLLCAGGCGLRARATPVRAYISTLGITRALVP